ncbi:hypothetical protein LSAT2_027240 [Lamellibrachia satsuma]|nr:hypothetical protein LSAT2_027240 [Lamellibrachia satsuma]
MLLNISAVCRFGSADDCIFPCHCRNSDTCNKTTGHCEHGCQKYIDSWSGKAPFSGIGCQIGNLARGKFASQVGDFKTSTGAKNAVNGDVTQDEAHCAHPLAALRSESAWWQVDLGDVYVINSVIIVNGYQTGGSNYLQNIYINIGNSSNVADHTWCGEQVKTVPARTNITIPCEGWGRHVSIRKYGDKRKDALLFCEVFVIGYMYWDCTSACEGSCSPVIGCDKCQVGKKMPDCKQDCDAGTYGINCAESCGHCAAGSASCDRVTGACSGGCQQWYGPNTCKAEIKKVDYSSTPKNVSVSSSSVSVSWPQSKQVPPGLESYYQYVVEAADGQSTKQVTRHFMAEQSDQTVDIDDLKHNTYYNIKVRIDAEHNTQKREGNAGGVLRVKTKCKAPAKPKIDSVTSTDPVSVGSKMGSLRVTWQVIGDSGCDNFKKLLVQYKKDSGQWQDKPIADVREKEMTIDNLQSGYYSVRLSVTNNENIESVSDTMISTVGKSPTKATVTTTKGPTSGTQTDDSDSTGVIIGVVMALVVLIVIVVVVVFVRLRKKDGMLGDENPPNDIVGVVNQAGPQGAQAEGELDQEEEEVERVNPVPEEGIYMNLVHASTMVQVDKLEAYIKERNTIRDGFVPEYNKLPRTDMNKVKTARLPDNVPLNRFKNIWPYDHSRVKLQMDDDHPSDYINASYITGYKDKANAYIACQGPRQNTLSDMWRMIWQLKITHIVMVTQLSESGRTTPSAPSSSPVRKGLERSPISSTHRGWTEGVPKYTYPLLALRRLIRSYDKHSSGPMVVHCSAGVGRTGTFIALDSLLDQAEAERQVDVYRFVNHMRTERMDMVQTQVQYVFLYHALLDGLKTGHLAYPLAQYPDMYKRLCDDENNLTELREQFQMLEALRPDPPGPSSAGLLKNNKNKNRSIDIIPDDNNRPYLTSRCPGTNDYINAVYVDSYRRRISFLLTQIPRPNTKVDFWRLILDHECPTIIMLDEGDGEAYWPNEEDPKETHGTLTVELLNERYTTIQNVVERELKVYLTATPNHVHKVKQYQLTSGWPCNDDVPNNSTTFLNLVELANRPVSEDDGSGPTILQCMNGASHSGLFCAATHLLGSLSIDQYVDIFHSAQHVRNMRPQAISSLEQYKFLHKLVIDYQGQHATYMNVPPSNRIA